MIIRTAVICLWLAASPHACFSQESEYFGRGPNPKPLEIDNGQSPLVVLSANGTLYADWDKIKDACQPQAYWDVAAAVICVLWAQHEGKILPMSARP